MNDICIIIPTHERPEYLRRCIGYYSGFSCRVIVCDSSTLRLQQALPENIEYFHLPGQKFVTKVAFALGQAAGDLVALAPDDDFLFEGALVRGAKILEDNPALSACVGDVLAFPDQPPFRILARCAGSAASAGSSSAETNIATYMGHYHQVLWSAFRRDTLLFCFEAIERAGFANENFFELTIATLCAGKGGIHYLDDYWILREVSRADHWGKRHVPVTRATVASMQADVLKFRSLCDSALFVGAGELALAAYLGEEETGATSWSVAAAVRHGVERIAGKFGYGQLRQVRWDSDPRFAPIRKAIGL